MYTLFNYIKRVLPLGHCVSTATQRAPSRPVTTTQIPCKDDREGNKDLEQQQLKFLNDLDVDVKDIKDYKPKGEKNSCEYRAITSHSQTYTNESGTAYTKIDLKSGQALLVPIKKFTPEIVSVAPARSAPHPKASEQKVERADKKKVEAADKKINAEESSVTAKKKKKKKERMNKTKDTVKRAVAVNTEKLEPFEVVNNGEITKREKRQRDLEKGIHAMNLSHERVKAMRRAVIATLQKEYAEMSANTQVMNKKLALLQPKLVDMVKRDQREKKENQEALKALKLEIKALAEAKESITKGSREKSLGYDRQLERFLELSNQSAAEKMRLEDDIRRCKDRCAKAGRRSQAAQLSNLENQRDQSLHDLYRSRLDAKDILANLEAVPSRVPPQALNVLRDNWRACVQEAEDKISNVQAQYQVQMEQVKNGRRLGSLPSISVPIAPQTHVGPMFLSVHQLLQNFPSSQSSYDGPQAALGPTPNHQAPIHSHPEAAASPLGAGAQPMTAFEGLLEHLSSVLSNYTRLDLICVASGVTQIILEDHHVQEQQVNNGASSSNGSTPQRSGTPQTAPVPVWQTLGGDQPSHALNVDDPCIICHDDMSAGDVRVLDCRHCFHKECIKLWLREQRTCPTCREHTLLPEDFPMLPATRRMMRRNPSLTPLPTSPNV